MQNDATEAAAGLYILAGYSGKVLLVILLCLEDPKPSKRIKSTLKIGTIGTVLFGTIVTSGKNLLLLCCGFSFSLM